MKNDLHISVLSEASIGTRIYALMTVLKGIGCFMDLMNGHYRINPMEPKCWDDGGSPEDNDAPEAFRKSTRLSQHTSFLKDFFRAYKDFDDRHIDTIEIMVGKLYEN